MTVDAIFWYDSGATLTAGRSRGWGIVEFETADEVRCIVCITWLLMRGVPSYALSSIEVIYLFIQVHAFRDLYCNCLCMHRQPAHAGGRGVRNHAVRKLAPMLQSWICKLQTPLPCCYA